MPRYLLKLSGEALGGADGFGVDPQVLSRLSQEIAALRKAGVELALVLGGGNLFRGEQLAASGMDRVAGDRMGMLATVMNGLAMADALQRHGVNARLTCAAAIAGVVDGYERNAAQRALADGDVVIISGGTGNPFFTTDTAACLRGVELQVDAVLKATNVDGVYSADPKLDPAAQRFDQITYDEVIARDLRVMDLTAIVLCKEHKLPLIVFDMHQPDALQHIIEGAAIGTRVVAS